MAFCFVYVSGPWALQESNARELANQSARYIGYIKIHNSHPIISCVRLILTQLRMSTVYLRTKPKFIYFFR